MPQVGPLEILVIFIVALLVFGPSKLPQIGRQVGRAFREFRQFQEGLRRDLDDVLGDDGGGNGDKSPDVPPQHLEPASPAESPKAGDPGPDGSDPPASEPPPAQPSS